MMSCIFLLYIAVVGAPESTRLKLKPDWTATIHAAQNAAADPDALYAQRDDLASPENLNPGTTTDRAAVTDDSPNVSYLKEIWHAIQTQDVTGTDALLALTQRPLTTPDAPGGAAPNLPGQLPPYPALAPPPPPPAPEMPGLPPPPPPAPLPPA